MRYYRNGNTLTATVGTIDAEEITKEEYETRVNALQKVWETKKDFIEKSRPLTESEVNRMLITQQINTLAVDDNTALRMVEFYPEWAESTSYETGFKVQREAKLYRCIQAHTAQTGWEPEAASSLWEVINETHAGTVEDPIPYDGNMALTQGKYYVQDYVVYLCTRDTINPVYNALSELVGVYVEIA